MNEINLAFFNGEDLRLHFDNKYYVGKLQSKPDWQVELFGEVEERLYRAGLNLVVSGEGTI